MIRMKAKNWLLSVMLVMACFCFFACKDTKVKVDSVSFNEQTISMLVGESYTPKIKILPSYANNRGYTLISEDSTALKVQGGTITALKSAESGVKLKVVSAEDKNINDVITVTIYAEAVELPTPSGLQFDGTKFTFNAEDDYKATAYMLKINGQEINIGNTTEYDFDNVVAKLGDLHNQVLTCNVKAIGDGKIFKDSYYSESEQISIVKLSKVNNAYVENETLYFDAIKDVASYNIEVLVNGQTQQTKTVSNPTFEARQLSLNISDLSDSLNGAEYVLNIIPNIEGYNAVDSVNAYVGEGVKLDYVVIGSVKNVGINNKVISWDFVNNAQSYTAEVYNSENVLVKSYQNIAENYINIEQENAGEYYCKIVANSNNANTTTGKVYSNKLTFTILATPQIALTGNTVAWDNVALAEGYLITIKNGNGKVLVDKKYVLTAGYDISEYTAGSYSIEVSACGNGHDVLTSKTSEQANWTILGGLLLRVMNQKLYWADYDQNTLNKYRVQFNTNDTDKVDETLTSEDYGEEYYYDEDKNAFAYDLSKYNFAPNEYTLSVQSVGEGSVFDATVNTIKIIKLAEGSIASLNNKQFTINPVASATDYEIGIYNASDSNFENEITTLTSNNTTFDLDDTLLDAGKFVAKVFVYGNNGSILDADNGNIGTTFNFEKLATPTIAVDKTNLKLVLEQISTAPAGAKYVVYENSVENILTGREYGLNDLTAGDYEYQAQIKGDGATILDSDKTSVENTIIIKKLATPTLVFDKENLTYTILCDDAKYVESYNFSLDNQVVAVVNGKADCSALMQDVKAEYIAKVSANPVDASDDYNLVIKSDELIDNSVSKLAGACGFEVSNGKLIVTPNIALDGTGYSLQIRIDNGENDIMITNFAYENARFETSLYDNNYNLTNQDIATLLQNPKQYNLFATISQNNENVIGSDEIAVSAPLTVLGRVETIAKNAQTIEFNKVDNATNYVAVVTLDGKEYYLDLEGKYTTSASVNTLSRADLIELMEQNGVEYREQTIYTIGFVATSSDTHTIANKGVNTYSFEFLKSPTISMIEQEGTNHKQISIKNDDDKTTLYNLLVSQGEVVNSVSYSKTSETYTYANLDSMTQFVAGNVKIEVKSTTTTGDYFESKYSTINAIKLDSPTISIVNGVLEWNVISNAKQYNLVYSNSEGTNTIALYEGVDNFTIQGDKCQYNFDSLSSGTSTLYIQVDSVLQSGGKYYLNSNNGNAFENVYKLPTLEIKVQGGQIYTEIRNSDLELIDRVEVTVDDQAIDLDITKAQDGIVELTENSDRTGITINPEALLKYGVDALLLENVSLKLYSNNANTLNSSTATKGVYGLLSPAKLDITTSTSVTGDGVIEEVFEKITWTNPRPNSDYVSRYEIVINYNKNECVFTTNETAFMMPTSCDVNEDINGNGELDEGEDTNENGELDVGKIDFGAGVYTIKVRALTDNTNNIVNSKHCAEITVTVLATPDTLSTKDGNVIWSTNTNVEYYLIKVYLLDNATQTVKVSSQSKQSEFDLCNLTSLPTGVYGITVQAMHTNSRILASEESEMLQVIRLPQVTKYFVKNGELYINVHPFYTKAEIYLTDRKATPTSYTFTLENSDLSQYNTFVESMTYWSSSTVLDTYTEDYFVKAKYVGEGGDATLRNALAEGYSVQVKLIGNTATKGAIISGQTSSPINEYWEDNTEVENKNSIEKLVTPTIKVSETERGVLLLSIADGLKQYSLQYYIDENGNCLQGVHLYQLNVMADKNYSIYVAEIVDNDLFNASLTAVGTSLIQDGEDKNYLKHFAYNGYTFNVLTKNSAGYLVFDFNTNKYYYYSTEGVYTSIDLSEGGSFIASVRFMGDDTQFVQSNISENATIKRYNVLNLTIVDGVMSWLNQASENDHPIYLITLTNEAETYNLVLYNPSVYTKDDLTDCLEAGKTYIFDTISYQVGIDEYITYKGLADIIYGARKSSASELTGLGGTFLASIRAHYTNASSTDIILAQGAESKTIAVLPKTNLSVSNGALTWDIVYVTNTGGRDYIYNYLLEVFDESGAKKYSIVLNSSDYNVSNYIATYEVPSTLSNGADEEFNFTAGENYKFKLTALAGSSTTYINSVLSETKAVDILPYLKDIKMEDGLLTWTNNTTNSVQIYVSYTMGDAKIEYITQETQNSFKLPKSFVDTNGTSREFVDGYTYYIKVRLCGNENSLHGFYSSEIATKRVSTIKAESIATNNGVLTWAKDVEDNVKYTIKYTLSNSTTGETEMIETNSYDFAKLPSGSISVQIVAHHNNYFSSFASETINLFKLATPTNIKFNENTTTISWDKVADVLGNEIDNYMVSIKQEGVQAKEYLCSTNKWIITGVTSNAFSIAVKAVSVEAKGLTINGEYTSYQSMLQPHQVDVSTFVFDQQLQAFKWQAIEGEQDGDIYYINYNYFEPNSDTPITGEPILVTESNMVEVTIDVDGEQQTKQVKYYYYYPSVIGRYSLVNVQVERAGSLSSQPTYCKDGENDYILNFNLFASGNGVDKPYIINSETELRNIKYFLNANYVLNENITLTSNLPITDHTQVFTGSINGGGKYIYGYTSGTKTVFSSGYVGLFNKVAGATFTNIQLSGFDLNGYLGTETLYMGILAGQAIGLQVGSTIKSATFTNIVVTSSTISLTKDNQNGYTSDDVQMYVGSIAGYANNAVFSSCTINMGNTNPNITIYAKGSADTIVSVGAVTGFANNVQFNNNNSISDDGNSSNDNAFIIQYTLTPVYSYIPEFNLGAICGEIGADNCTFSGNSCEYTVYTSQGSTTYSNEFGNKN